MDFSKETYVSQSKGVLCRNFVVSPYVIDPHFKVINLPKLKTHGQMIYTGAIKNIFGCVPGIKKKEAHLEMFSADNFAKMIVDLYSLVNPPFTIMDAIVAMEGNGPRSGNPRNLGFIIAGEDSLAIDSICARIIGLDPLSIPILRYAAEFGIGNIDIKNIITYGDDWRSYCVKDFKNYSNIESLSLLPPPVVRIMKKYLINKPAIDYKKCILCKKCIEACPLHEKAIYMKNNRINYDYKQCIRCFCCQEICPEGAIYIKETLPWKILSKIYKLIKG